MEALDLKHYSFPCGRYINNHGFKVENGYLYIKKIHQEPFVKIELTDDMVNELENIRRYTFQDDSIRTYKVFILAWIYSPKDEFGRLIMQW